MLAYYTASRGGPERTKKRTRNGEGEESMNKKTREGGGIEGNEEKEDWRMKTVEI